MSDFDIKDSGARKEFESGMVRDTEAGKIDYTTITNGPMFDRWAVHLTKAQSEKYPDLPDGTPNWMQAASSEELFRFRRSAWRHFLSWMRGETDEDHAAALFFNVNGLEYVREQMESPRYKSRDPLPCPSETEPQDFV